MAGPNGPNNQNDNRKRPSLGFIGIVVWAILLVVLLNSCLVTMRSAFFWARLATSRVTSICPEMMSWETTFLSMFFILSEV